MWMMIFVVVLLVISVVLVFLILSQDVKGGGLAGALGGGSVQTAFGGRSAESIAKLTAWLALAFFVLILMMNILRPEGSRGITEPSGKTTPSSSGGGGPPPSR